MWTNLKHWDCFHSRFFFWNVSDAVHCKVILWNGCLKRKSHTRAWLTWLWKNWHVVGDWRRGCPPPNLPDNDLPQQRINRLIQQATDLHGKLVWKANRAVGKATIPCTRVFRTLFFATSSTHWYKIENVDTNGSGRDQCAEGTEHISSLLINQTSALSRSIWPEQAGSSSSARRAVAFHITFPSRTSNSRCQGLNLEHTASKACTQPLSYSPFRGPILYC